MPSAPGEAANPSRRRPRLSSSSSSSAAASKRPKFADAPAMASARARGKLPETVDLTPRPSAFQPYTGAKKLVIKNLRAPSSRDAQVEEYYARTERELDGALGAVFAGKRPAVPLERLYRGVEDVCRRGSAEKVYTMLTARVEAHLQTVVLPRIRRAGGNSNLEVLRSVLGEWTAWNSQVVRIRPDSDPVAAGTGTFRLLCSRSPSARRSATLTEHICFANLCLPSTT